METKGLYCFCTFFLVLFLGFQNCVQGRLLAARKPDRDDVAAYARWLVSQNPWVQYETTRKEHHLARNALKDRRSSLAISEYPLGTCGNEDPESPVCAKITLTGKLVLLNANTKEAEFAQTALFTKHPEMKGWPRSHNFQIFKLEIEDIFMINWFGGPKPLTVEHYLNYKMNKFAVSL